MRVRFWSVVIKRGTHLAQSFFISNSSCKIYPTCSFEMPIVSAISSSFIRRSSNAVLCTCSMISGVALFGRPSRASCSRLVGPRLNSAAHSLIVENEEESPHKLLWTWNEFHLVFFYKEVYNRTILNFIHFKVSRQHSCFRQPYKTNYLIEWLAVSHGCLWWMYQLRGKKSFRCR